MIAYLVVFSFEIPLLLPLPLDFTCPVNLSIGGSVGEVEALSSMASSNEVIITMGWEEHDLVAAVLLCAAFGGFFMFEFLLGGSCLFPFGNLFVAF